MSQVIKRLLIAIIIGLIGGTATGFLAASRIPTLDRFEAALYDLRMQIRAKYEPSKVSVWDNVVFVDIDDQSLTQMTFPVPRDMYEMVVEALNIAGAKAIGFDILFSERTPGRTTRDSWDELHYSVYETFQNALTNMKDKEEAIHNFIDALRRFDIDQSFTRKAAQMKNVYFPCAFNIDPEVNRYSDYISKLKSLEESRLLDKLKTLLLSHKEEFSTEWFSRTTNSDRASLLNKLILKYGKEQDVKHEMLVNKQGGIQHLILRELDKLITKTARDSFKAFVVTQLGSVERYYSATIEEREELDTNAREFCRFNDLEFEHAVHNVLQDTIIYRRIADAFEKWRSNEPELRISDAAKRVFYEELSEKFPDVIFPDSDIFDPEFRSAELKLRDLLLLLNASQSDELAPLLPFNYEGVIPLTYYLESSPTPSYIHIKPDYDGVVRKWPLLRSYSGAVPEFEGKLRVLPMMSFQLALHYLGVKIEDLKVSPGDAIRFRGKDNRDYEIPVDENCEVSLNWTSANFNESFTHISFLEIYDKYRAYLRESEENPNVKSEFLDKHLAPLVKGKLVLIGLTATGTHDFNPTPLNPRYPMVGAHGNFISNLMTASHIKKVSPNTDFLLTAGVIFLLCLLMPLVSYTFSVIWFVFAIGAYLAYSYILLTEGIWINSFYVLAGAIFSGVMIYAAKYVMEGFSRAKLKKIFSVYLSPKLVDQMADQLDDVKLGGQKMNATVYFSDVAGFTSISEKLSPEMLVEVLNKYLSRMTDNILAQEGLLDKYIGDAVVAAFGVPFPLDDHAKRACRAALKNNESLEALNRELEGTGAPRLEQRIGLNSGELVAGNMGSEHRLAYTVMGDTVNLGSRLENANKYYGSKIMISEFTYEQVKDDFVCRKLDVLKVVGKAKPVAVYELIGEKGKVDASRLDACTLYEEGITHYLNRRWQDAIACFERADELANGDKASRVFVERCKMLEQNPPSDDWDGVWELTSK